MAPLVRVVQATAWYPPQSTGGTEVYLDGLVRELQARGVDNTVLVPGSEYSEKNTEADGDARIRHYRVNEMPLTGEIRSGRPHVGFDPFRELLRDERGAIYHQHAWTRGCGPHHLQLARDLGFRTVVTVHVAVNLCLRGTMMRFGRVACDGRVEPKTCGACYLHGRGVPRIAARFINELPSGVADWVRKNGGENRIISVLSSRVVGDEKRSQVRAMIENADRIVVVCEWLHAALLANGAPREKLRLSRHGVSKEVMHCRSTTELHARLSSTRTGSTKPLRLLYIGRWDPDKGIELLVRAVRALPANCNVMLTVHAASARREECGYEARVRRLATGDARIVFAGAFARRELGEILVSHDVLAAPSVCLETGPLVVHEARAVGLFVLGSRLGGIAELVTNSSIGSLVAPGDQKAWSRAIQALVYSPPKRVPRHPDAIRTISHVASDMIEVYGELA